MLTCLALDVPDGRLGPIVELLDFCLIFVPFGHDDEPEILRNAITSICSIGADVRQIRMPHRIIRSSVAALPTTKHGNDRRPLLLAR